jgi:hypothetical protein
LIVSVNVTTSSGGILYCSSFVSNNAYMAALSVWLVKSSGVSALIPQFGGIVAVELSNLIPATDYNVYCYTESLSGDKMTNENMMKTETYTTTACCRDIYFTAFESSVVEYNPTTTAPNAPSTPSTTTAINFQLDSLPSNSMQFLVTVISNASCDMELSESVVSEVRVTPSSFVFHDNSLSKGASFIISYSTPGCYLLYLSSASFLYNTLQVPLRVTSVLKPPKSPEIVRVVFSNDGLKIVITFDSPTNQGKDANIPTMDVFSCNLVVEFPGSALAKCIWTSAKSLVVSGAVAANVGDSVVLRAGVLKPLCNSKIPSKLCLPSSSSKSIAIEAPSAPVMPIVTLSTAASISLCDEIALDPTSSKGDAGRPWKSVIWTVTSINPSNRNSPLPAAAAAAAA